MRTLTKINVYNEADVPERVSTAQYIISKDPAKERAKLMPFPWDREEKPVLIMKSV